jgi:phage shock protein PspC (stress-responsive transcriptional regulator)
MDTSTGTQAPFQQVDPTNGSTPDNVAPIGPVDEPARPGPRYRLRRSRSDRMISGVCGGVGKLFNVDANLVRIGLVALTIVGVGAGAVLYVAAWLVVPEEDA